MNPSTEQYIDLDRFPFVSSGTPEWQRLVDIHKNALEANGASIMKGVIKQDILKTQIQINENLEENVRQRTLELTEANRLITQSINSASIIQNVILPEIDCNKYGFREFEYLWLYHFLLFQYLL